MTLTAFALLALTGTAPAAEPAAEGLPTADDAVDVAANRSAKGQGQRSSGPASKGQQAGAKGQQGGKGQAHSRSQGSGQQGQGQQGQGQQAQGQQGQGQQAQGKGHAHQGHPAPHGAHVRPGPPPHHGPHAQAAAQARARAAYHRHIPAHHYRGTRWHARPNWTWGVWVYPAPVVYVEGGPVRTEANLPERKVDREDAFSLGAHLGAYASGYDRGGGFADGGLGLDLAYRPVEAIALDLAWSYHDDTFADGTERITNLLQPSVNLYAVPWSRVSPYFSFGLTWASQNYEDTWSDGWDTYHASLDETAFGPSVGAGLEIAIGERVALDLNGKLNAYVNTGDDASAAGSVQYGAGLNFYF